MIYFDSSALVKRYLKEIGSDRVKQIINHMPFIATSKLTFPEILSAFARKYKTGDISEDKFTQSVKKFEIEWNYFLIVEIQDELFPIIKRTLKKHYLKGADSIHLSSAIWLKDNTKEDITFVSADKNLIKVVQAEKIKIINPQKRDGK